MQMAAQNGHPIEMHNKYQHPYGEITLNTFGRVDYWCKSVVLMIENSDLYGFELSVQVRDDTNRDYKYTFVKDFFDESWSKDDERSSLIHVSTERLGEAVHYVLTHLNNIKWKAEKKDYCIVRTVWVEY